jgi:hypothetical protein
MFVLCLLYSKGDKGKRQDNQNKEVRLKYKQRIKEMPVAARFSAPVQI